MEQVYELDAEDEEIINELDNFCGVVQNKEALRNVIRYLKLKESGRINFGNNNNAIIRNNSSYDLLNDFLKVYGKILLKYKVIKNNKICYLDNLIKNRRDSFVEKFLKIEEDIIVINERKMRFDFVNEKENLTNFIKINPDKIIIFEDTSYCEGELDAELGDFALWRFTIDRISLDDKLMYCKNKFEYNNLQFKEKDLKEFIDIPFWQLKNWVISIILEAKSKNLSFIDRQMLKKNKNKNDNKRNNRKLRKFDKNATEELDELIGLEGVKSQIYKILNYIKLDKERGKNPTLHMCFTGNPGTGKTSIARIIGKLFEQESIISGNGEFIEIHGRDLVDKYVGWTAQKVHYIVERAIGGVLFIDEAYSLVSNTRGSFEDEAIATLIKEMEDHREEICIILAGYTDEIKNLINLNPGFESRIPFTIDFPNYNSEELLKIFKGLCKKEKYKLSNNCEELLLEHFEKARKQENFGNGRYVRNFFEKIKFEQADRIVKAKSKGINTITLNDIKIVINNINIKKTSKKRVIGF